MAAQCMRARGGVADQITLGQSVFLPSRHGRAMSPTSMALRCRPRGARPRPVKRVAKLTVDRDSQILPKEGFFCS